MSALIRDGLTPRYSLLEQKKQQPRTVPTVGDLFLYVVREAGPLRSINRVKQIQLYRGVSESGETEANKICGHSCQHLGVTASGFKLWFPS